MFHARIHLYMQRIRDLETCWRRKDIGERSDKEIMVFSWYSYKKTLSYNVINSGNQLGASINTPARREISSCSKITFLYILYDFVCGVNKSLFCCCQLIFILSVWPNFSPNQIVVFWMSISWRQRIYWYMDILRCVWKCS